VGNPNVGKSVLFNALTGAYVTVSNYPGTSVEVARGTVVVDGVQCEIIDTPGMYSILPITEEERVAREILLHESPDVVLHVLDARNLERMLAMTLQLIEAGLPVILVVNIMDEAERMGLTIDIPLLQEKLGVPVIGTSAAKKKGLPELREAILRYDHKRHAVFGYSRRMESDLLEIMSLLSGSYSLSKKSLAILLLQKDDEVVSLVREKEGDGYSLIEEKVREKLFARRDSFHLELSMERRMVVKGLIDRVFHEPKERKTGFAERLGKEIDKSVEDVGSKFKDAVSETGEKLGKATDDLKKSVDSFGSRIKKDTSSSGREMDDSDKRETDKDDH
jgi:ferrous iron transport protein B